MLTQVVSSVFDLMPGYLEAWRQVRRAEPVPLYGFPHGVGLEPVRVDVERMLRVFRNGARDLDELWRSVLAKETHAELQAIANADGGDAFRFPDRLWARAVYDFAVAYARHALPGEQLLGSLFPLYLGRTASFVLQTAEASAEDVERIIAGTGDEFLTQKPYLLERWG
jgi:hypothetical protein